MQLHGRDALFSLGQKVNGLKPDGQRQFARFKDGAGDERHLAMAAVAMTQFAGVQMKAFVVPVGQIKPFGQRNLNSASKHLFLSP